MASSRTLISSQTLASSAASVTFSAIPSTYTDLCLRYTVRTAAASTTDTLKINFNGTTTGYSQTFLRGDGSAPFSGRYSTQANGWFLSVNGNTTTANTFTSGEMYIPSYTASQSKPMADFKAYEDNSATAYTYVDAFLYADNNAISSLTLISNGGNNLLTGSSFYLYGLKAS